MGCATVQNKRNAELVVHYNGVEVSRSGSKYTGLPEFTKHIEQKSKKYIIFAARWCKSCKFLDKALAQSGHEPLIIRLDADELWVNQIMAMMGLSNVPTMVVIDEKESLVNTLVGPSKIIMYLIINEPTN